MKLTDIQFTGHDLVRPECVIATNAGNLYVSDFRGGVSQVSPSGNCRFYGGIRVPDLGGLLQPNGICLQQDGSFLAAHLGADTGGVYTVKRNNEIEPWLQEIQGQAIPPSNFIYLDHQGRYWLTVSTRHRPRSDAYRSDVRDGFIAVIDEKGARIVADDIGYANEVFVTPDGKSLFVNLTFSRETYAYDIGDNNDLKNPRLVTKYDKGIFPDGLTMDEEGMLWVTSIVSNSILRVSPKDGRYAVILQDVDAAHLDVVESAYMNHSMGRPHLDQSKSQMLQNISSLAFFGTKRNNLALGCLLGAEVATLSSAHTGIAPAHWYFEDTL